MSMGKVIFQYEHLFHKRNAESMKTSQSKNLICTICGKTKSRNLMMPGPAQNR